MRSDTGYARKNNNSDMDIMGHRTKTDEIPGRGTMSRNPLEKVTDQAMIQRIAVSRGIEGLLANMAKEEGILS